MTDDISVLTLNTLFYDSVRSSDLESGPYGADELVWLIQQLEDDSNPNRKFILTSHIYPGARYDNFALFREKANAIYFDLLEQHKDKILIELAGHDHFASLRAHVSDSGSSFHNIFIGPSITPWYSNNPGVSSFEVSDDLVPHKLRSTFLNLQPTIGQEEPLPFGELEFRELNY